MFLKLASKLQSQESQAEPSEPPIKPNLKKVNEVNPSLGILKDRAQNLKDLCAKKNINHNKAFPTELFVLKERNLAYCAVPKAGTSTWMTYLVDLSTKPQSFKDGIYNHFSHIGFEVGRQVAPRLSPNKWMAWVNNIHERNQSEIRIIVVRHPFERLVSAFRQKLERLDPTVYRKHGRAISNYRSEYIAKFGLQSLSSDMNFGAILPVNHGTRTSKLPTFWEFVQWIIRSNGSMANIHWIPIYHFCSICAFGYDYVVKHEHYHEENLEFMQETGLFKYLSTSSVLDKKVNVNRPDEMLSTDITKLYFEVLSNEEIQKLFQVYQNDFQLFNYSFTFRNVTYS